MVSSTAASMRRGLKAPVPAWTSDIWPMRTRYLLPLARDPCARVPSLTGLSSDRLACSPSYPNPSDPQTRRDPEPRGPVPPDFLEPPRAVCRVAASMRRLGA